MNPNAAQTPSSLPLRSVVIVASDYSDVSAVHDALPADFDVTFIDSFKEAKTLLAVRPPDLLIACLRLGEYNGLHLVLRGKAVQPAMAALVLSRGSDAALEADAERLGATFVVQPSSRRDLAAAVARTLFRRDNEPIRAPYERRVMERRVSLLRGLAGQDRRVGERRGSLHLVAPPSTANGI